MKAFFVIFLLVAGCGVAAGLTREYIFIKNYFTWRDAQSHCRNYYRDLATVTSYEENERFTQARYSKYGIWIGLYMSQSGTWMWSDKEPSSMWSWAKDYPFFNTGPEKCVLINIYKNWMNQYCSTQRNFYCYRFLILVKEKKTWHEALEFCRTNYTGLASVTSEESLKQVKLETVETETENVWTGLRFMEGQWFWVKEKQPGIQLGSLVSESSCPDLSYRCGALNTTTDTLNNLHCNEKLNFVCYWV